MFDISPPGAGADVGVRAQLLDLDWSGSPLGPPDRWPEALRAAFRMVLDSAFPMFIAWGPQLGFLYNDAYARILGDKHPAALGARFQQVWPEIWSDIVPIIDRALSNKPAYFEDLPLTVVRKGYPEQSWFTFSYSPLHEADGSVAGMYCTVIETTARVLGERRAAFELRLSDALRPLTSPQEVLATASALLGEQLGLSRVVYGEVDAQRDTFHIPFYWTQQGLPDPGRQEFPLAAFGPEVGAALRAGQPVQVDDVAADPRTAPFADAYRLDAIGALLTVPLLKGGRLVGFLSLNRTGPWRWSEDEMLFTRATAERTWAATENVRAQAALRAERDRSRYLFDTIAEGFAVFDRDWTILEVNPEGLRIIRMRAEDVVGKNHWEVFAATVDSDLWHLYQRTMRTREPGTAEYCLHFPGGGHVWAEVRAYPTQDGGIASFFRDITDRKQAEDKLRAADQRKDEFLAMLAHELRNPLAPIAAAADLLRVGRLDEARVRQSSAIISRQVKHMTSLVNDLLDVSRVTRGLVTLAMAPVTAHGIVDEAVEQVLPLMQAREQQLSVFVADEAATVLGDKARLVQVLANVLGNAAKYTPDRRGIDLRAEVQAGELVIRVRDEGIGMEPELTGRVFELFAQAERSSDRSLGGLGLGLALVKNLVELHGGTVGCASPGPGKGSTFTIALPLMRTAGMQEESREAAPIPAARRLKLMVVDDNVDAAETLAMLLEACGHEVIVEHGPLRALERAGEEMPDVCLLDIGLPDMDGNELARRLKADRRTAGIVLVAVTGYGQAQDRAQAFDAGFRYHLVKPVDMARLEQVLGEIRR